MFNTFGEVFKITTFGESHGSSVGVVLDGVQSGIVFNVEQIKQELFNRKTQDETKCFETSRVEDDEIEILSGVFDGKTLGSPICIIVRNKNKNSKDYELLQNIFRPGHADYTYWKKYGIRDYRGGGRASGRETVSRVIAGAFAKDVLFKDYRIKISSRVQYVDGVWVDNDLEKISTITERTKQNGDSVGGIIELNISGVPAGLGDPQFQKLTSKISNAMFSIGGIKAVEFGDGFGISKLHASEANDEICIHDREIANGKNIKFKSNHAGGILGGISNGEDIIVRLAVKAPSSISLKQKTINQNFENVEIEIKGRHDSFIGRRVGVVAENMAAIAIYDSLLIQKSIEMKNKTINDLRFEIDLIDENILQLISERNNISQKIGEIKNSESIQIQDLKREEEVLANWLEISKKLNLDENEAKDILNILLSNSKKIQK